MPSSRLSLDRIACVRGDRLLFDGVDLTLAAGGAAMLRGPNGAGKSSLLRIIAGLLPAVAGTIERQGSIALAAEASALDEQLPLARALLFWARLDGGGPADVAQGLAAMGLEPLADVPVRLLSTGQRRRATVARVIAANADIWLLDEPGNGLDAAALDRLADAMTYHRLRGGIVVAASHQPLGLNDAQELRL